MVGQIDLVGHNEERQAMKLLMLQQPVQLSLGLLHSLSLQPVSLFLHVYGL